MLSLLKKLFGGTARANETHEGEPVEYEGYVITPRPSREAAGWRVCGTIEREIDGERRVHTFIRADVYMNLDDTVQTTLSKGRRLVEEQGERMFRDSHP